MLVHYLFTIILSLVILFFPQINKFNVSIINSNIYLKLLSILTIFAVIIRDYLNGLLLMIIYLMILDTNSTEINEGFIDYYN